MGEAMKIAMVCLMLLMLFGFIGVKAGKWDNALFHVFMLIGIVFFALGFHALLGGLLVEVKSTNTHMIKETGETKTYEVQTDENGVYDIKRHGNNLSIPIKVNETDTDTWLIPNEDVELIESTEKPKLVEYNADGLTTYELYLDKKKGVLDWDW